MMSKFLSLQNLNTFFILIFLQLGILCASETLDESYIIFDETYGININKSSGIVTPPDILFNRWKTTYSILFENGLYGTGFLLWKNGSQAKQIAELDCYYSGIVNIVPYQTYWLVHKDNKPAVFFEELYLSRDCKFEKFNKVLSITENIEVIPHWFLNEYKYRYVIELDDGTSWLTKPLSSSWKSPWEIDSKIVKVGNSQHPCFINISAVQRQNHLIIESNHYLTDLERL